MTISPERINENLNKTDENFGTDNTKSL